MRRLALVLLVLAVAVPACTGGGDSAPSLEERRESYLEQAEAVCRDANEQEAALEAPTTVAAIPAAADAALSIVRQTVSGLEAVEPPAEDRQELQAKVLGPLRSDVGVAEEYAERIKSAAAADDGAAVLRLVQERPQTSADLAFLRDYGFDECVRAVDQKD